MQSKRQGSLMLAVSRGQSSGLGDKAEDELHYDKNDGKKSIWDYSM